LDARAKQLAEIIKTAAKPGLLEGPFRHRVEEHLIGLAKTANIEFVPQKEVTLGTSGRADTIYNRFIVEWEKPASFRPSNNALKNSESITQVKKYGDSLYWRTRERAGRIVGCCTDGHYFIFLSKPAHDWIANEPVPVTPETCQRFLDYFFSLASGVALIPEYLSEDFSSENVRTQRCVHALYQTLSDHIAAPSLEAVFDQWAQFFGAVTEYEHWRVKLANESELRNMLKAFSIPAAHLDLNRFFFATHTYFAILTKLLAYLIVGRYTDLPTPPINDWKDLPNDKLAARFKELEQGGPFRAAGIRNYLEGDFFSWYTKFFTPELGDCLRGIIKRLADYDPATLDLAPAPTQDLLKKLYHRLVSPHIRKALGEYYTPDWLAQRLLNMLDGGTFRGDPNKRLLDPACGSGTFLLLAINAVRRNSIAQSLDEGELLRTICHNIVGIDLNPLAVIAARTNYLLALGPLLKHRGDEPLEIPVYLADSIMTPSRGADNLFDAEKVRVLLSIGKVELPRSLATQDGVATLTNLLDKHLDKEPATHPGKFLSLVKADLVHCGANWEADSDVIAQLYVELYKLHAAGRNGLWARILKNAFAPVFLAPFDYIAGNPPWIGWENLPEGYRTETTELWKQQGLFVHSGMDTILGKGKKDISMLMTYIAADSYLKEGGKLGFVITQAVFKMAGAAQGFRRFKTRKGVPLNCLFVDDFSDLQLFEGATNKTAVFIMQKGQKQKYPVTYTYWRKKEHGRKGSFGYDATLQEVTQKTARSNWKAEPADPNDSTSSWLTGNEWVIRTIKNVLGKSDYSAHAGVYTGGANAVYWFEILKDHKDGTVTARNLTEGAKRIVESVQVRLEKELLYPLLIRQDVAAWKAVPSAHLLFVQDVAKRCGIDEDLMKRKFPLAYDWLSLQKPTLLKRSSQSVKNLMEKHAFYSMFAVGDYTVKPWKVIWPRIAKIVEAVVVSKLDNKIVLAQETFTLVGLDSEVEANYVAGVLNSTLFRYAVSCFSQPGSKSFGTPSILEKARIPKFEPGNNLHEKISAEARRLASGASDALEAMYLKLDSLCAGLWRIDEKGVRAVQDAYSELYAPVQQKEIEAAVEE